MMCSSCGRSSVTPYRYFATRGRGLHNDNTRPTARREWGSSDKPTNLRVLRSCAFAPPLALPPPRSSPSWLGPYPPPCGSDPSLGPFHEGVARGAPPRPQGGDVAPHVTPRGRADA